MKKLLILSILIFSVMKTVLTTLCLIVSFVVISQPVSAEVIKLLCKYEGGTEFNRSLIIDLNKKVLEWNNIRNSHKIVGVEKSHITAINFDEGYIGGEVLVLNRISGRYWRARVKNWCIAGYPSPCQKQEVSSDTRGGVCKKQLF